MNRPDRLRAPARAAAALCAALAVLLVPAAPAWAHNALRESTPSKGSQLALPPNQVELVFAERLDPKFTTVAVTSTEGATVTTGKPTVAGTRATQPLAATLAAGSYTVAYRVVSVDGHPVQGSFTFTIAAATRGASTPSTAPTSAPAPAATSAADSQSPDAAAQDVSTGGGTRTWLVVAVLAAAAVMVLLWRLRGRRR